MTRVSENSNTAALNYSLSRAKRKLEDLQLKGSSLKRMVKPSDDPIGNVDVLGLRSRVSDNGQFRRSVHYAQSFLEYSENAISDLANIMSKAKEIAIAQSSDTFGVEIRRNVAKEVQQLRNQAMSIANKRFGNKYIFAGYATHQRPFTQEGKYFGDSGHTFVEVSKDFFVPINLTGKEVFFAIDKLESINDDPLSETPEIKVEEKVEDLEKQQEKNVKRTLANYEPNPSEKINKQVSVFNILDTLNNALLSGSSDAIQNILEEIDDSMSRIISLRTKIGSVMNSVANSETTIDDDNLNTMARKSKIEDADIAQVFSDLQKQQGILKATYKTGSNLIERSLVDFLR